MTGLPGASVAEDVEAFRSHGLAAAALHDEGKVAAGNRRAGRSHAAYERLRASPPGRRALLELLQDPEPRVQLDVAGRLFPHPEAVAALEAWAAQDDRRGRSAAWTLEWARRSQAQEEATLPPDEIVLAFHGWVMNGGVDHALGVVRDGGPGTAGGLPAVLAALRGVGLEELADLVVKVVDGAVSDEEGTDRWSDVVPSDAALAEVLDADAESQRDREALLAGLWTEVIDPWGDPGTVRRVPGAQALVDDGVDPAALAALLRGVAHDAVFCTLVAVDDADLGRPGLAGLHEDLLGADPRGREGADLWDAPDAT